ncbi:bipartate energy taxis response protein CetB [Helicobacter bizzozeronii]|uniref:PAS domain-containing protein n=1 Tax=Helicobacter bizzozeronii TaxID=56877 RepID=UPI000CF1957B|nr:PAS domain-containing protein [Helicobacter bizzozeronii]GMB92804.1 bipartate energy taxis response protein CetB [Helicobacter bizzozeronii]
MEKFVKPDHFLVTKTNLKGAITYANKPFLDIVNCNEKEILHKPHNVVRHPEMPKVIFRMLWEAIMDKREIFAYIKNKTFDGNFYWVFANVTASVDDEDKPIGYYSVRRAPNRKALDIITPIYADLLEVEKRHGMQTSSTHLQEVLDKQGCGYDEWVNKLQRL